MKLTKLLEWWDNNMQKNKEVKEVKICKNGGKVEATYYVEEIKGRLKEYRINFATYLDHDVFVEPDPLFRYVYVGWGEDTVAFTLTKDGARGLAAALMEFANS